MGALSEPMGPQVVVPYASPEDVTDRRRRLNADLQAKYGRPPTGPSSYELDFYERVGRTPPTD
jgi:hypothetical protein